MLPLSFLALVALFLMLSEGAGLHGIWLGFAFLWLSATPLFLMILFAEQREPTSS
jgi:hypothetical protein